MNKELKSMLKDAGILLAITVLAGLVLGGVYEVTKQPIAEQKALAKQQACQEVFADAASFDAQPDFDSAAAHGVIENAYPAQDIDEVMQAKASDGSLLGYVITVTTHEGYGGDIQFSMGVTQDGTLNGISILSISETAGLGMRADEVLKPQFAGKKADTFVYTKGGASAENEIDAITGATITTNAVTNGVNAGMLYFREGLGGAANE